MSFDEDLADRVRRALDRRRGLVEKKMFGALAFLLNGHMCCGVLKDDLIVRVPRDETDRVLARPHTRAFDFTGKPMRGMVVVEPEGCDGDSALAEWVEMATQYTSTLPAK